MQIRLQANSPVVGGRNPEFSYDAGRDADGIDEATAGLENTPVETTPPAPDPERPNRRVLADDSQELTQIEEGGETVVISPELTRRNQAAFNAFESLREAAKQLIDCNTPGYYDDESRAAVLQGVLSNLQNAEARLREATQGAGGMNRGDPVTLPESEYHVAANGRRVRYDVLGRETEQPVTVGMLQTTLSALQRRVNRSVHPHHANLRVTSHTMWIQRGGTRIRIEPDAPPRPVVPAAVTPSAPAPEQTSQVRLEPSVERFESHARRFYDYLARAHHHPSQSAYWLRRADQERAGMWRALEQITRAHPESATMIRLREGLVPVTGLVDRAENMDIAYANARNPQPEPAPETPVALPVEAPASPPTPNADEVWNNIQMGFHHLDRASEKRPTDPERSRFLELAESNLRLAREALQRMQASNESAERFGALQGQVATLTREISELRAPIF